MKVYRITFYIGKYYNFGETGFQTNDASFSDCQGVRYKLQRLPMISTWRSTEEVN